jgi:protein-tyrosine phosphatase
MIQYLIRLSVLLLATLFLCIYARADLKKESSLVSPFPSTVPEISIPNTHRVGAPAGSSSLFRGMEPRTKEDAIQLRKAGIEEVIIFKNSTEEGDLARERKVLVASGFDDKRIFEIPFKWRRFRNFAEGCEPVIKALKFLHKAHESRTSLFFHCTVGEDRTGLLAGLYVFMEGKGTPSEAYNSEMCPHGYGGGDPDKPAEVIASIDEDLTPLYLKLAYALEKNGRNWSTLDKTLCSHDPATEPGFIRKYGKLALSCDVSPLYRGPHKNEFRSRPSE